MTRVEKLEKAATELRHALFELETLISFVRGTELEEELEGLEGQAMELALPELDSTLARVKGLSAALSRVR